jgi:hypothetical protein
MEAGDCANISNSGRKKGDNRERNGCTQAAIYSLQFTLKICAFAVQKVCTTNRSRRNRIREQISAMLPPGSLTLQELVPVNLTSRREDSAPSSVVVLP